MLGFEEAVEIRGGGEVLPDYGAAFWLARQQVTAGVHQVDEAVFADIQPFEQVVEVSQAQGAGGDTEKCAIGGGDTPAEGYAPFQVGEGRFERRADDHSQLGVVAQRLENPALGKIGRSGHDIGRVGDDVALAVEPEDIAAKGRRDGVVEQDLLAQFAWNSQQVRAA
ncbi:hypothetical protein D3C80_797100 [compost metagenome]